MTSKVVDLFDEALRVSKKRLRESSRDVYRSMWTGYVERLGPHFAPGGARKVGQETAVEMLASIDGAGEYSVRQRLFRLVRWTYQTVQRAGRPIASEFKQLEGLFIEEQRPTHQMLASSWQEKMVLAARESAPPGWKSVRLAAIVAVLCETALRNNELVDLRIQGVIGTPPDQLRAGKKSRVRDFPLSHSTALILTEWLAARPPVATDYLFVADELEGRPMDPATLWRQLKKVTQAAQADADVVHYGTGLIRATRARELSDMGADTGRIADFLGHRREKSTDELLERVQGRPKRRGRPPAS